MRTFKITGKTPAECVAHAAQMGIHIDPIRMQMEHDAQAESEAAMFSLLTTKHGYTLQDISILKHAYQASAMLTHVVTDESLQLLVTQHDSLPAARCRVEMFDCLAVLRAAVNRAAMLTCADDRELMAELSGSMRLFLNDANVARQQLTALVAKNDLAKGAPA